MAVMTLHYLMCYLSGLPKHCFVCLYIEMLAGSRLLSTTIR